MSDNPTAVFLSYASQDAETAQHLADGLRSSGIDVWFDQSELRGGDAWDAMIRKRIKNCALFVPVVSRNTEARQEGYFRLEWKLAVDRSHLMSDDKAFIVPVVIDDTDEATARVPEAFRARQWARLLDGGLSPAFVRQIHNLMEKPASDAFIQPTPRITAPTAPPESATRPMPWRLVGAVATAAVVVVGTISYFIGSSGSSTNSEAQQSGIPSKLPAQTPVASVPVDASRGAAPQAPETRIASAASTRPPARAAAHAENPLKTVSIESNQPAAVGDGGVQPLRIVQGAPLGQIEEPKLWAVQVELAFWDAIKTSTMVEDYDEYLLQYPAGRFAGLARNRIKALKTKR